MKRLRLYTRISNISIIAALVFAIIRRILKPYISVEIIRISLYISIFFLVSFVVFTLLKYIEKKNIERKSTNYDDF